MGAERGVQSSAEPRHWVRITKPFYLGVFPVTQAQYRALAEHATELTLNASPSDRTAPDPGDPADHPSLRPVENVSWIDAEAWCGWIQTHQRDPALTWKPHRKGLPSFERISLPTEAQWEYACRAGTGTEYSAGDGPGALEKVGWFDANSGNSTRAVGRKAANDFGLHDMHGNVWEWCRDAWDDRAYRREQRFDGVQDPEILAGSGGDPDRVVRGGSWVIWAWYCRSAIRNWWGPDYRDRDRGFRVCLFPGP
jgi:formylglycine-generating enzyme required for sulfatase activity